MVTAFQNKVYKLCSKVPRGKVTTYGAIAKAMKKRGHASRAVGQALNKNPFAPAVPCHRVVASDGTLGGFDSGLKTKIKILEKEGIRVRGNKIVDFNEVFYKV